MVCHCHIEWCLETKVSEMLCNAEYVYYNLRELLYDACNSTDRRQTITYLAQMRKEFGRVEI